MSTVGLLALLVAFVAALISAVCLAAGHVLRARTVGETVSWSGRLAALIAGAALTLACGVMVACFVTDNFQIQYVLDNHVSATGALGTLYRVSGLWAGREGSLLFWAWLIALFGCVVSVRRMGRGEPLDNVATLVIQLVLAAFVGVMLFSRDNMPFIVTDAAYFAEDGTLTDAARLLGMNSLLQHWAMAIHPPLLFLGYAGLTVPFAYALAAVVADDPSRTWVLRCERFALAAWLFLTLGIGLGSVWAYVVLGWGGYWGWDPVENASLLAWLLSVALVHSLGLYRQRGAFKGWSVLCACLAFAFCIVGTFISRSGIVQSVHAFEGDPVSLGLFGALIVVSVAAGAMGWLLRRRSFAARDAEGSFESLVSREGAQYVNNLVMVVLALLLTYLTVASALPGWLPLGGESVSSGTYEAIARPLGIVYLLMVAACPLLSWGRTASAAFWRRAKLPALCALVLFAVLMVYLVTYLVPAYDGIVAQGGSAAEGVLAQGPRAYYLALSAVAFAVAALLVFNSLFQLRRALRSGAGTRLAHKVAAAGAALSHAALAVILAGLVGSGMYVTEASAYLPYDAQDDTCSQTLQVKDYELVFCGSKVSTAENGVDLVYQVDLEVYRNGAALGHVRPAITLATATMQQRLDAAVLSLPGEDLFVVYQGVSATGDALSIEARVNPLVQLVWAGFGLLCVGMLLSLLGWRRPRERHQPALTLAELGAQALASRVTTVPEGGERP